MNPKAPSASQSTLHQYMMPEHANPAGSVHGGLIMKMMDEAGAIAAMRHAQRRVVTIAVDSMTFKSPVEVGQLVTMDAKVTYVGRTSVEVSVRVLAEDPLRCQSLPHMRLAGWDLLELIMVSKAEEYPELFTLTRDGNRWHWINRPLGIDQTFTSDAIYGKRLTITYNTSNQPLLKLDGQQIGGAGSPVASAASPETRG